VSEEIEILQHRTISHNCFKESFMDFCKSKLNLREKCYEVLSVVEVEMNYRDRKKERKRERERERAI